LSRSEGNTHTPVHPDAIFFKKICTVQTMISCPSADHGDFHAPNAMKKIVDASREKIMILSRSPIPIAG
jgi:hypothetical protein